MTDRASEPVCVSVCLDGANPRSVIVYEADEARVLVPPLSRVCCFPRELVSVSPGSCEHIGACRARDVVLRRWTWVWSALQYSYCRIVA